MEDFFKSYIAASSERESLRMGFSKYIIARCWQKMYRRICHWSSRETFRWLASVDANKIQKGFDRSLENKQFELSRRADSMLGGLLIGQNNAKVTVESVIKRFSPFPKHIPDIPKLADAVNTVTRSPGTGWYTKDTCVDFHKHLLSAIIAYTNALHIFNNLPKKQVVTADYLYYAGYLLWRITDARILRHHLKLLSDNHLLPAIECYG